MKLPIIEFSKNFVMIYKSKSIVVINNVLFYPGLIVMLALLVYTAVKFLDLVSI